MFIGKEFNLGCFLTCLIKFLLIMLVRGSTLLVMPVQLFYYQHSRDLPECAIKIYSSNNEFVHRVLFQSTSTVNIFGRFFIFEKMCVSE